MHPSRPERSPYSASLLTAGWLVWEDGGGASGRNRGCREGVREVRVLDWVALAVIVGCMVFLRRRIAALARCTVTWVREQRLLCGVAVALVVAVLAAWKVPIWQLASRAGPLAPDRYLELQNAYRATIVQALAGVALLVTIYLTWRRVAATEQQVEVAREEQITERFTRAIEQLGSDKLEVRLGGIYALERIARDSEKDHWPIMEVLTAYVRVNARRPDELDDGTMPEPKRTAPDIQAILTVIGRRRSEYDVRDQHLDLKQIGLLFADLRGSEFARATFSDGALVRADLRCARLHRSDLSGTELCWGQLDGADLREADLTMCNVYRASVERGDFRSAKLWGARLNRANLRNADLRGADFGFTSVFAEATLERARLHGARLDNADLRGVDLSEAAGLTRE